MSEMSAGIIEPQPAGMSAGIMDPQPAGMTALSIKPTGDNPDRCIKNNQKVIIVYGNFSGNIN